MSWDGSWKVVMNLGEVYMIVLGRTLGKVATRCLGVAGSWLFF